MASHIERRKFLATLLGGAAAAWPRAARAQQPAISTVGFVRITTPQVPDINWDGTVWNNAGEYAAAIAQFGGNTDFWGHATYWSASCGTDASPWGVTAGYSYHLPPTWYSQPTRKFPVMYYNHGGYSDEAWMWMLGYDGGGDPLDDAWYDSAPAGGYGAHLKLNWGKNAPCVIIFTNNTRLNYGFDAKPGAPMYGRIMTDSALFELIDECERSNHPIFGGRLVPEGNSDPNGGRARGIGGGSGGSISAATHVAHHPDRFCAAYLHCAIGMNWWVINPPGSHLQVIYQLSNNDHDYWMSQIAIEGGIPPGFDDGGYTGPMGPGPLFMSNIDAIRASGVVFHVQTSVGEGMEETARAFAGALPGLGVPCTLDVIPYEWHTSWCQNVKTLTWFVSKCKLWPTCNGPTGLTATQNIQKTFSSAEITARDTDPQNLPLTVISVSNPSNCSVSVGSGTVTFNSGSAGSASFDYSVQNSDGWTGSGTASVQVSVVSIFDGGLR